MLKHTQQHTLLVEALQWPSLQEVAAADKRPAMQHQIVRGSIILSVPTTIGIDLPPGAGGWCARGGRGNRRRGSAVATGKGETNGGVVVATAAALADSRPDRKPTPNTSRLRAAKLISAIFSRWMCINCTRSPSRKASGYIGLKKRDLIFQILPPHRRKADVRRGRAESCPMASVPPL